MGKDKFLTVYAVLDDDTQSRLAAIQAEIEAGCVRGTQTRDIPFHISLGTFHPSRRDEICELIRRVASSHSPFAVEYKRLGSFGGRVLFAEPMRNSELEELQSHFNEDYAGGYEWSPHSTLLIDENCKALLAKEVAERLFMPFSARVVALEMGEFFPTEIIIREYLK